MRLFLCTLCFFFLAVFPSHAAVASPSNAGASRARPASASDAFFDPEMGVSGSSIAFLALDDPVPLADEPFFNVLRFDVTVDNDEYVLLFSPSYRGQLYVDKENRLWNMGTSQVQGLVLTDTFDPYHTTGTLVYLAPCLGNNFSANETYGSPNWFREYYWNYNNRLTYDDRYVQIVVTETYFPFSYDDLLNYVLIFLVGGGVLLCWLNRFRRY